MQIVGVQLSLDISELILVAYLRGFDSVHCVIDNIKALTITLLASTTLTARPANDILYTKQ